MNKLALTLCFILFLTFLRTFSAIAQDWNPVSVTDDSIKVFMRERDSSDIYEYMATVIIDAKPARVYEISMRKETYAGLDKYVIQDKIIETADKNVWYNYQLVSPPVVSQRDYFMKYLSVTDTLNNSYVISWHATSQNAPPCRKGVIRISQCRGSLTMIPLEGGTKTRLVYKLYLDPGGWIPDWITNYANKMELPDLLRTISTLSLEE